MIARKAWRLFADRWPHLLAASLFTMLLMGLVAAAGRVTGFAGAIPLGLAVWPLATGGFLVVVIRTHRREPVGPGDYWRAGVRHWRRLGAVQLRLTPVWLGLVLATYALSSIGGRTGLLVGIWLVAPVCMMLAIYAPYATIAEGLSAPEAATKAMELLRRRYRSVWRICLAGGALLLPFSLAIRQWGAPGWIAAAAAALPGLPYLLLYLAVLFELRLAPYLERYGGEATFHANPTRGGWRHAIYGAGRPAAGDPDTQRPVSRGGDGPLRS